MDDVAITRRGSIKEVMEGVARGTMDMPAAMLPLLKDWHDDWTVLQQENEELLRALTE